MCPAVWQDTCLLCSGPSATALSSVVSNYSTCFDKMQQKMIHPLDLFSRISNSLMWRAAQRHPSLVNYHRNISFNIGIKVSVSGRSGAIFISGRAECGAGGDAFYCRIHLDTGGVEVSRKRLRLLLSPVETKLETKIFNSGDSFLTQNRAVGKWETKRQRTSYK